MRCWPRCCDIICFEPMHVELFCFGSIRSDLISCVRHVIECGVMWPDAVTCVSVACGVAQVDLTWCDVHLVRFVINWNDVIWSVEIRGSPAAIPIIITVISITLIIISRVIVAT